MKSDEFATHVLTEEKKLDSVKVDVTAEVVSYEKVDTSYPGRASAN